MPIRSPVKPAYEPAMCARRPTHYMYQQQHRPEICSWKFCARHHEELTPRRLLIPQVSQLEAVAQKYQACTQNTAPNLSIPELQNDCSLFVASARQLAKALEVPLNIETKRIEKRDPLPSGLSSGLPREKLVLAESIKNEGTFEAARIRSHCGSDNVKDIRGSPSAGPKSSTLEPKFKHNNLDKGKDVANDHSQFKSKQTSDSHEPSNATLPGRAVWDAATIAGLNPFRLLHHTTT
ncbi:hypothetical protein KIW84_013420 [Lathyrus oleraceus]|uniref:Uncharacterized protein n=1 Tax=Pisum sativum TaxID=3888 RepID=A0A9D5BK02_PEA|nr:hypothetical protein KIW84_013418 [Pisum sativum]KAI5445154.1 hypothetical protein KIW84_013420 [Pisum sativum]